MAVGHVMIQLADRHLEQQNHSRIAKHLNHCRIDLGKPAIIVNTGLADADIDAVVQGIKTFGFYNAGQDCTAACRIYADARIYDRLVADNG